MSRLLAHEWLLFQVALGTLTRIPVRHQRELNTAVLQDSGRYLPLVGALVGLFCGVVFLLACQWLPVLAASVLCVVTGLVLTGAFHEDGLADTLDGLLGGYSIEQKLAIMKDSRVGTYGMVGLWAVLTLKVVLIAELPSPLVSLICAHCLSRALAISLTFSLDYVQPVAHSKFTGLSQRLSQGNLLVIAATATICLIFVPTHALWLLLALLLFRQLFARWLRAHIKGFSGDTLGAAQQLCEVIIYMVFVVAPTGATV